MKRHISCRIYDISLMAQTFYTQKCLDCGFELGNTIDLICGRCCSILLLTVSFDGTFFIFVVVVSVAVNMISIRFYESFFC